MSGMLNTLLDINQIDAGIVHPEIVNFRGRQSDGRLKGEFTYRSQAHGIELRVVEALTSAAIRDCWSR